MEMSRSSDLCRIMWFKCDTLCLPGGSRCGRSNVVTAKGNLSDFEDTKMNITVDLSEGFETP